MTRDEAREIAIEATDKDQMIEFRLREARKIEAWLMRPNDAPEQGECDQPEKAEYVAGAAWDAMVAAREKSKPVDWARRARAQAMSEAIIQDAVATGMGVIGAEGLGKVINPEAFNVPCDCDLCKADGNEDKAEDEEAQQAWVRYIETPGTHYTTLATFKAGFAAGREPRAVSLEGTQRAREAVGSLLSELGTRNPCTMGQADDLVRAILRAVRD